MSKSDEFMRNLYAKDKVLLAPMEDVTDEVFRRLCRGVRSAPDETGYQAEGADVCFTGFVNVERRVVCQTNAEGPEWLVV